ncbi:DNA adenine methylase [Brevundimonas nasdae]|uniref:DNA adenine methylase n=1 Tax=Brevundimonas nasdae TaxID=172043 RepID=UPI003F68BBE8
MAPWIGGKRNLARRLCALIEATPHDLYAEPFVGQGGVFFRRKLRPKCEIVNDWSGEVANLFRCMRAHAGPLNDLIAWTFSSREEWDRQQRVDPRTLTDLQRAARFVYLQKLAFGGKVTGQSFGVRTDGPARWRSYQVGEDLLAAGRRLRDVTIENLPWQDFIRRYDRPGALFYLDPPYFGCEDDYGAELFDRGQFREMAEVLGELQGRFILSLNDRPEVRGIFGAFQVDAVTTHYGLAGKGSQAAGELIITPRERGAA